MRILYVALKETLPGSHGGAVHVLEVARQLARRGHALTVVVQNKGEQPAREQFEGFEVRRLAARSNYLLARLEPSLLQLVREIKPDVVMERYYTFAGAGVRAARACNLPVLLEVNAPMTDPPGSAKHKADRVLLGALTRLAREQALAARRIVTPLAVTVPFAEARDRVREIPWGANVELFDRAALDETKVAELRQQLNPHNARVVAFLGSFRPWHGVREFVQVARAIAQTRDDILFLLVGSGELLDELRGQVAEAHLQARILFTGAVPYDRVPYYLALADVGVAPFNLAVHPPLRVGFYWSPLKVHEYMAMGLPVVTVNVPGLNEIARQDREGLLYPEGDLSALQAAVLRLVDDPALAQSLGRAGRARVVEHFSWQEHAAQLERVLNECLS